MTMMDWLVVLSTTDVPRRDTVYISIIDAKPPTSFLRCQEGFGLMIVTFGPGSWAVRH